MTTLIVFSHLRWDFVFQRPQHLLTRLAKEHRVLYVEEPVFDADRAFLEPSEAAQNITVLRPHTTLAQPGFTDDQLQAMAPLVRQYLESEVQGDVVAWFYTPLALPLLCEVGARAVIYDCMDELAAFKGAASQMRQREAELLQAADLVLTGGPSLYAAKRDLHHNVHCLPSAVDAQHFRPDRASPNADVRLQSRQLQQHIPAPRIGFFGVIDERIDLGLIAALAALQPDWHLVMVGPVVKIDPAALPQAPNIHWLGSQPYAKLPMLVADWDVCILPFALNEHTRFISPTKTLEYLAAEKPCVSTPVIDVVEMYGDVVAIASTAEDFVAACTALLGETPADRNKRLALAAACVARHSWSEAARKVRSLMAQVLVGGGGAPASEWPRSVESAAASYAGRV